MEPINPVGGDEGRPRTWPVVVGVLAVVAAVLTLGVVTLWPSDGDGDTRTSAAGQDDDDEQDDEQDDDATTTSEGAPRATTGEPSAQTPTTKAPEDPAAPPVALDLLRGGLPTALADLLAAAGGPEQVLEIAVYDTYAFLAYRDPADPSAIDERMWRDGEVGDAEPNAADDRFDAETEAALFSPGELSPGLVESLVADAVTHYDVPTAVTHVLVTRFLPFDDRVLIRVYAAPTDGRSGGGYVSYDTAGTLVRVCC